MARQSVLSQKKRRGPLPTGKGELIGVRLQPPQLAALDSWIDQQPEPKPSRPEAIRVALRDWLIGLGIFPLQEEDRPSAPDNPRAKKG
jgi:hypothetical protein